MSWSHHIPVDTNEAIQFSLHRGSADAKEGRQGELRVQSLQVTACALPTAPQPAPWVPTGSSLWLTSHPVGTPKRLGPGAGVQDSGPRDSSMGPAELQGRLAFRRTSSICLLDSCMSSPNRCSPAASFGMPTLQPGRGAEQCTMRDRAAGRNEP